MPILDIEFVLQPGETIRAGLAAEIADRAGEIFVTPKGGTWVKLHPIQPDHYAENGAVSGDEIYPVFVSVLKAHLPASGALLAEAVSLTAAIALVCGRPPENVHIIYEPPGTGRIAFGGKV